MSFNLSPIGNTQQVDASGIPISGGRIYTYLAGTTTPATTYKDAAGATPHANPIVLDSLGIPANPIWLTSGVTYKFTFTDAADVPIRTVDNISGINDTVQVVSQWTASGFAPTYIGASSFSVAGDQTADFHVGRRLQMQVTAGTVYGIIISSAFGSVTTVTMTMDSTSLDAGLSSVNMAVLTQTPSSIPGQVLLKSGGTMTGALTLQNGLIASELTPVGTISDYAGTSSPSGWLLCPTAPTNISRTTYARLFTAIGTTWGAGDGANTFGMPYFPDDYAAIQANANVGTASTGDVKAHTHTAGATVNLGVTSGSAVYGVTSANTGSTGGSANLPAGIRVLKILKY